MAKIPVKEWGEGFENARGKGKEGTLKGEREPLIKKNRKSFKEIRRRSSMAVNASIQKLFGDEPR